MDPNETLRQWRAARAEGTRTEAREFRGYLRAWLARGGFAPVGLTARERLYLNGGRAR